MDKKFILGKKLIIPIISFIMLVMQVCPAFAISQVELARLMQEAPEIAIEVYGDFQGSSRDLSDIILADATPTAPAQVAPTPAPPAMLKGGENWLGLYPTYQLTNFPEMRSKLEQIFPTSTSFNTKTGMLYPNGNDTCYWRAIATKDIYQKLQKPEIQQQMKEAASNSYSDVTGTEWYADKIAFATYYGVINGIKTKEGKFEFRGNTPVTRAEFPTMLYRAMWEQGSIYNCNYTENSPIAKILGGHQWYTPYVHAFSSHTFLHASDGLNAKNVLEPMTRIECAYMIAKYFYSDELWRVGTMASDYFKDATERGNVGHQIGAIKPLADGDVYRADNCNLLILNEMINNPSKGLDDIHSRALAICYEKGIIKGDQNGNSLWSKPVTRAEAVQIIYNLTEARTQTRK